MSYHHDCYVPSDCRGVDGVCDDDHAHDHGYDQGYDYYVHHHVHDDGSDLHDDADADDDAHSRHGPSPYPQ